MTRHWVDTATLKALAQKRAETAEAIAFAMGPERVDLRNKLEMIERMIVAVETLPND